MGYGVYEDSGNRRWAGYMVPGECDMPGCKNKLRRGLDAKCEGHIFYEEDAEGDEQELELDGCGFFFCGGHQYVPEDHSNAIAKPDTHEWMLWMLTEDSWAEWRAENPAQVKWKWREVRWDIPARIRNARAIRRERELNR